MHASPAALGVRRQAYGTSCGKIGNVHLEWAFSEAAVLFLARNPEGKKVLARLEKKHPKHFYATE